MHARGLAVGVVTLMAMLSGGVILANPSTADEMPLAKSVGTQLPLQDFRAMELDEDRGRLYFAQGAGSSLPLVVTDLDGVLQRDVTDVTGVSELSTRTPWCPRQHTTLRMAPVFTRWSLPATSSSAATSTAASVQVAC